MKLLLDLGNTRLKWQLVYADDSLSAMHALTYSTGPECCGPESWQPLFDDLGNLPLRSIWLSNVAGARAESLIDGLVRRFGNILEQARSPGDLLGLRSAYADPEKLGIDRFLAMLGARTLVPQQAVLVILLGTAMTIDLVNADGTHQGGLIVPGPNLMRSSLHRNTAALPDTQGELHALGRSTVDAMYSGSLRACAALIHELARDNPVATLLLSGGATANVWPAIAPDLQQRARREPELVLIGLKQYSEAYS